MEECNVVEKTVIRALGELVTAPHKIKAYREDKRITQNERMILSASADIRNGRYREVINYLESLKTNSEVIESQRLFFLGCAYNNLYD